MDYPESVTPKAVNQTAEWEQLEHLLATPNSRCDEWQLTTARLTGLAHVATTKLETTDLDYLRAIALLRWSQVAGVREAKKRIIRNIRFTQEEPPSIAELGRVELLRHGVEVLSSIRASWCKNYAEKLLGVDQVDRHTLNAIIRWSQSNSASIADILVAASRTWESGNKRQPHGQAIIKELVSLIPKIEWRSIESAGEEFISSAAVVGRLLANDSTPPAIKSALWGLMEDLAYHARDQHPFLVIETSFLIALADLRRKIAKTLYGKPLSDLSSRLERSTVSCCLSLLARGDRDEASRLMPLLRVWEDIYPGFRSRLEEILPFHPRLSLLFDANSEPIAADLEDRAASIYARLLPEWDDYVSTHPDDPRIKQLNQMLLEAAQANSVEFLGSTGETASFDPVIHVMVDAEPDNRTNQVKLIRPAVVYRRGSGNYRVIVQALVTTDRLRPE
jgi:hypothetical protein